MRSAIGALEEHRLISGSTDHARRNVERVTAPQQHASRVEHRLLRVDDRNNGVSVYRHHNHLGRCTRDDRTYAVICIVELVVRFYTAIRAPAVNGMHKAALGIVSVIDSFGGTGRFGSEAPQYQGSNNAGATTSEQQCPLRRAVELILPAKFTHGDTRLIRKKGLSCHHSNFRSRVGVQIASRVSAFFLLTSVNYTESGKTILS